MQRIKKFFLNGSIGSKLMLYFVLVILLPTITITALGNIIYKSSINEEQNANTQQMVKQINSNIDFYLKETENIIDYLAQDPRVNSFLNNKDSEKSRLLEDDVTKAIMTFTPLHPEIAGIMVVNKYDLYVSDIMFRISRDPLIYERWYTQAVKEPEKAQLFSKPVGRNINNVFQYCADDVVSMSKAVLDRRTGQCLGVILVDMKLDIIKSIIEDVRPAKTGFVYIVDANNEIVYSPINPVVYRIRENWLTDAYNKTIIKKINYKDYEILDKESGYTGWRAVGVFPLDESLKVVTYIKYTSMAIAIVTMLLASILAVVFTRSIVNPIAKLRSLMKKTEEGDLEVHFNSKYKDEIGELGNAFNNMIDKIKGLINLVQIEEKNKRKAEINTLQAQIKPHFLYNTLDTIQWTAQEHNAEDIVEIVTNLTNLLRIGLNNGEETITVKQELRHVESYLIIQKVRYEDKFTYNIQIEDKILDFKVIKLILQPLVENAIYHGIKEKRGRGNIDIKAEIKEEKLHFIITDNGMGIRADKLIEINAMLQGSKSSDNTLGFGIYNVNERIKLTYGEEYGIEYKSIYGEGTAVEVWHPIIKNL